MKFVDNWMRTHRKYSAQAMAASAAIQAAWVGLPDKITAPLPPSAGKYVAYVVIGLLVLGIFGSTIDQGSVTAPPEDQKS